MFVFSNEVEPSSDLGNLQSTLSFRLFKKIMSLNRLQSVFKFDSRKKGPDVVVTGIRTPQDSDDEKPVADLMLEPGELSFAEDTSGGMGRHLGLFSTTFLM